MPKVIEGITLYSTNELLEKLGVTKPTLLSYLKKGKLKGLKIGRGWYVSSENLKAFLQGNSSHQ